MIFLYNVFLTAAIIIALPFIFIKSLTAPRVRYKIKDRFLPSIKVKEKNYMLFHASSFGEVKTLFNIVGILEKKLGKKPVFSVFTDTGYRLVKNKNVFIMPIDLCPLYKKIFANLPDVAFFFETEIWPSYISFLKKRGVKLALINARMSDKSLKFYKIFSFLFKKIIGKFDIIIAKSEQDADRFKFFNDNVAVCGNIKQLKKPQTVSAESKELLLKKFLIETKKPILTFGSVHKEERDFVLKAVSLLKNDFFIVIAPRHTEDVDEFYFDNMYIEKRSHKESCSDVLLLDTMGELEDIYKISDIVFIGGSTKKFLNGHNPIEPLVYNKFILSGRYMSSFENEVKTLMQEKLIRTIDRPEELFDLTQQFLSNSFNIDSKRYFGKFSFIADCYINKLNEI